jgi:fatty acid desaturase
MDEQDILWNMYQEHCTQGRHIETLRATTTNILLAIAAGAIAVITHGERPMSLNNLPLAILLIPIGLLGVIFSWKYHERFSMHMERARQYRDALEELGPASNIRMLKSQADAITKQKHPIMFDLRLYKFWIGLHFLVAILGLILTVVIIMNNWVQIILFLNSLPKTA